MLVLASFIRVVIAGTVVEIANTCGIFCSSIKVSKHSNDAS